MSGAAPVTRPFLSRLLLVLLAACTANGFAQAVELQSRVFEIAGQLRCPVCVSESVADSNAQLAQQMRELIQQQLEEGRSEAEIFAYFTNRYGDWILLDPPKRGVHLLVWLLPIAAVVIGVAALALTVRRWLARSRERPTVDQEDLERVRAELRASDS
ncbi:MAG TPA: cytochrome c-type biogenesis protein [Trueperaceae bacterium]|nr:cytochrome c-type biogenesis protein [Trueperaceae bacterium]